MTGNYPHGCGRHLEMSRDEHAHALVRAIVCGRLAHEYLESSFLPISHELLACVGPDLYTYELRFGHIISFCSVRRAAFPL